MNKYNAVPTEADGIRFASKAEARRYQELRLMQAAGRIVGLEVHPRYPLVVNGVKVCDYIGDFRYIEDGRQMVEDVKSPATRTPLYRLKKRLMLAVLGIEVIEVQA